jgi:hypothetical protein
MATIQIYTREWCPYCAKTKVLPARKNLSTIAIASTSVDRWGPPTRLLAIPGSNSSLVQSRLAGDLTS